MKKLLAAVLALSCLVLAGCGGAGGTASGGPSTDSASTGEAASGTKEGAARPNEIYVGIAQDLDDSLDPHKTVAAGTREVLFNVFEGLVKPATDGSLVPALASDYEISDDHLTYTFTMRSGVQFHNGEPVTAADAAYSILRCKDAADPGVLEVKAFAAISDVSCPEDGTLVITLSEPSNEFLSYLTCAVIPADYPEQDTAPVGTGPFRFVSRTAQENVVLERFDDYWGEPAKLEKATYRIIENADSIMMSLQSGAVDLFAHLTITQAEQLPENFHVEEGAMNLVQALYLNNAAAPFDDVRVRRALCYAVDKQGVLDYAFSGYGFPIGSSMYPAFGKYFDETLTDYYPHDIETARELLAEAGYPDGFHMSITVPSNYQPHLDTAQVLVEQLREIGVQAEILPVEWGTWLDQVYTGRNYQSTVIGVDAADMTARALLERFTSSAGNNFINYHSDKYDELFALAQSTYEDADQTAYYKQMEADLAENAANVYIQDMADLVAVRDGLEGVRFYPIYVLDLSGLEWLE